MRSQPDLDRLLLQLFDVAASPQWGEWLEDARQYFGATSAAISPLVPGGARWMSGASAGVEAGRLDAYRHHFFRVDKWMHRIRNQTPGVPHSLSMLVPDHELMESEIYNDFMRPGGRRYGLGVTVESGNVRFILNFGRTLSEGDFDDTHFAALSRIAKFVPKALNTQRTLHAAEANNDASQAVMNQSPRGVLLLDSAHRVVFANRVANDLINAEQFLGIRRGQLVALGEGEERRFRDALDAASREVGFHTILMLGGAGTENQVATSIVGISDGSSPILDLGVSRPTVLVDIVNHSEQPAIPPEHLIAAFGFTMQEARTASLLASGLSLPEVAARLSISRETVRYHLKGLFAKSGAHSQRELVQFITALLPPIAMVPPFRAAS